MDRNGVDNVELRYYNKVALRKESVDRNQHGHTQGIHVDGVALRKESVDRNSGRNVTVILCFWSLSARRAWIEMLYLV